MKPETRERVHGGGRKDRLRRQFHRLEPAVRPLVEVTVFVASLHNPHFAAAMQGALDAFEGSRYHLMFSQTGYIDALRADIIEPFRPFRPGRRDLHRHPCSAEARDALRQLGVPVVELWGGADDPIDMVAGASIEDGARLMGEHFGAPGLQAHRLLRPDPDAGRRRPRRIPARGSRPAGGKLGFTLADRGDGQRCRRGMPALGQHPQRYPHATRSFSAPISWPSAR